MQQQQLQQMSQNAADDVSSRSAIVPPHKTQLVIPPHQIGELSSSSSSDSNDDDSDSDSDSGESTINNQPPPQQHMMNNGTNNNNAMMVNNNNHNKKGELPVDSFKLPDYESGWGLKATSLELQNNSFSSSVSPTAPSVPSIGGHMDNSTAILRKDLCLSDSASDSDY